MDLENIIHQYGYLALVVGTFLEGETILVLGGIAAKMGYLELPGVIAAAFAGTLAGDQLYFFLGRFQGHKLLAKRPKWRKKAARANRLLERYQALVIIGFRFIYGIRTITPFVIGMSRISAGKFLVFNTVGALAWATLIGSAGYLLGHGLELILGNIQRYEMEVMAGIGLVGAGAWLWHLGHPKKSRT